MDHSSPHTHSRAFFRKAVVFFLLLFAASAFAAHHALAHAGHPLLAVDPGSIAKDQTICAGETPTLLASETPATGHDSFRWEVSTDGGANWTPAPGTKDGETYQPGSLTETTMFRRVAVSDLDGEAESNTATITVNPIPPAPTVPRNEQIVCQDDTVADLHATGDNIKWYAAATGGNPLPPAAKLEEKNYYASQTVDKCESTVRVKVSASFVILSPGQIGEDEQIVCAGGPTSALDSKNGDDGLGGNAYFWQKSATGNDGDWAIIPNATNRWYPPAVEDAHYRRGKSAPADDKTCTVYSNAVSVKVNAVHPGEIGADQLICRGDVPATFPSKKSATGLGTLAYQWQVSADGSLNWNDIPGATGATYTPSEPLTDSRMYRRWATSSVLAHDGLSCRAESNHLTVKISNVSPGGIAGNQTICPETAPAELTSTEKGNGISDAGITYRWEYSTDGGNKWDKIDGTAPTAANYSPDKLSAETMFQRVTISKYNGTICEATSHPVTVKVSQLDPGKIEADQTICENGTPAPITSGALASASGTVTYGWESWMEDSGKWESVPNATDEDYAPPGPMTADAKFRRVAFVDMGGGKTCEKRTEAVTVTVNQVNGGSIIDNNEEICQGGTPQVIASSLDGSGTGGISYQWEKSTDNGASWAAIGGATLKNYQPDPLTETTMFRRMAVSLTNADCKNASNPITVKVNVVPAPIGSSTLRDCGNAPGRTLAYASQYYNPSYEWYAAPTGGTPLPAAQPLVDGTTYYASQTVSGCESAERLPVTYRKDIMLNPGTVAGNQIVNYPTKEPTALTGTVAGSSSDPNGAVAYAWVVQNADGSPSGVVGNEQNLAEPRIFFDTQHLFPLGPYPLGYQNKYYRLATLTVDGGYSCEAKSADVTIKINGLKNGSIAVTGAAGNQTVCDTDGPSAILPIESKHATEAQSYTGGKITYRWEKSEYNEQTKEWSEWTLAPGTNDQKDYQPGNLPTTTRFQRWDISDMSEKDPEMTEKHELLSENTVTIKVRKWAEEGCKIIPTKIVKKEFDEGLARSDEILTYTIKVRNTFDRPVTVDVTDTTPEGTTYVAGSANPAPSQMTTVQGGRQMLVWKTLSIPKDGSSEVSFQVKMPKNMTPIFNVRNFVLVDNFSETVADPWGPEQKDSVAILPVRSINYEASLSGSDANGDGLAQADEELTYSITIKNTGNVNLKDISVSNAIPKGTTFVPGSASDGGILEDGVLKWKMDITVEQDTQVLTFKVRVVDDLAGIPSIDNTAIVYGRPWIEFSIPTVVKPNLTLTKTADRTVPKKLGEKIEYTITAKNTGDVTLSNIVVTDPKADNALVGIIDKLAPGKEVKLQAWHTVSQADIDNKLVYNQAMAEFLHPNNSSHPGFTILSTDPNPCPSADCPTDPNCLPKGSNPACPNCTVVPVDRNGAKAELSVEKAVVNKVPFYRPGEFVRYSIRVRNTGGLTLTNIKVTDANADSENGNPWARTIASLSPNQSATFTARHTVTALADANAGKVDNTATATGQDPDCNSLSTQSETVTVPVRANPEMFVRKKAVGTGPYALGDKIEYEISVENTGDVVLTDVLLTDDNADSQPVSGTTANPIPTLARHEVHTFKAVHTVTQDDVDMQRVDNQAVATAKDPAGNPVQELSIDDPLCPGCSHETTVRVPWPKFAQRMSVEKTATNLGSGSGENGTFKLGDPIEYAIRVKNTGKVTLRNIVVRDNYADNPDLGTVHRLAPDQDTTLKAVRTVNQDDVDAAFAYNRAVAVGRDPRGDYLTQWSNPNIVNVDQRPGPSMSIDKKVVAKKKFALGEAIEYAITVTNTGTLTLQNIRVEDANANSPNVGTIRRLSPGQSQTLKAYHTVDQDDVDRGWVDNIATALGRDPQSNAVTGESIDPDCSACPYTTAEVDQSPGPAMSVEKTAVKKKYALGEAIEYRIRVRNTGTLTLRNIAVTDSNADDPNVGTVHRLSPGQSQTLTAFHTVNQDDVERGWVDNLALAAGTDPQDNAVTAESKDPACPECPYTTVEIDWGKGPSIDMTKEVVGKRTYLLGEVIHYTVTLTNSGTVTLNDIAVTDSNADNPNLGTVDRLAIGESRTFTASHKVTQDDVDRGWVDNQATAAGKHSRGGPVTGKSKDPFCPSCPYTTVSVDWGAGPGMSVQKAIVDKRNFYVLGETIEYAITVTNTGTVTLRNITVTDANADDPNLGTVDRLALGESRSFAAFHTVTQADVDAERVDNLAVAVGRDSRGGLVKEDSQDPAYASEPVDPVCPTCTVATVIRWIEAVDDRFVMTWLRDRSTRGSVLDNDLLGILPIAPEQLILTPLEPSHRGLFMHADGKIEAGVSVVPGFYEYPYRICEVAAPDNCSDGVAVIEVLPNNRKNAFIPNVFTPNGDGVNDTFEIIKDLDFERVSLVILNRWGGELYTSDDYQNDWGGEGQGEGTYFYIVTLHKGGHKETHRGWVLLVR